MKRLVVALAAVVLTPGLAQSQDQRLAVPYARFVLPNGLNVILHEDNTTPTVSVNLWYNVGSGREKPGRTGFAHLFEHILFEGSENVLEGKFDEWLEAAGGNNNGSTNSDRTNYWEDVPSNALELALFLESDRMGHLLGSMSPETVDGQRNVVKNERRQSYENRPYGLAVETILEMAYPKGHPYRHPTIGFMEDLDAADLEDMKEFFKTFYTPDNAVLALVGAVEADRGFELADRYFGEIPSGSGAPRVKAPVVAPSQESRREIRDNVRFPRVYMFHHTPALGHPGFEALDVLSYVLAEGKSSRLYQSLVYEKRIAQDVTVQVWPTEDCGLSFMVATARHGVSAAELERTLLETLDEVRAGGLTEREVQGGVNRLLRDLVLRLNGVGKRSEAIATSATFLDRPEYVNEIFDRVGSVTLEEIVELSSRWWVPERRATLFVLPENSAGGHA